MTLLDAPKFDARREKRKMTLIYTVIAVIVLVILIGVGGLATGHGWFFNTVPSEHRVDKFFEAVEAKDFNKAYGVWNNDADWQQHADKYKAYDFTQFQKDWGPTSDYGVIKSHKIDIVARKGNGVIMAVNINGGKTPMFLRVDAETKQIGFSPIELYVGP